MEQNRAWKQIVKITCYSWFSRAVVGFEVLIVVVMNVAIFWDTVLCSLCVNPRFQGTYHLLLKAWPRGWRWHAPPKCWFTCGLHGAISQMMATFCTAVTCRTTLKPYVSYFQGRGTVVAWDTMLQTTRLWVWDLMRRIDFFILSNPSSCTRPWGLCSL
jgi:hypothetical protein